MIAHYSDAARRARGRVRAWSSGTLAVLLVAAAPAGADPLYSANLAPVANLLGFPALREAQPLARGNWRFGAVGSVANNYSADIDGVESVSFDGENQRVALLWRAGLGGGWEIEAELPWLRYRGGELDAVIENWHDLWGLPDGNRDEVPRGRVGFDYTGADAAFSVSGASAGVGDARLGLVRQLWTGRDSAVSGRLGVKLGTGDADKLLGSGGEDLYASLNASGGHRSDLPIRWHMQVGYLRAGDIDLLGDIQERHLWFAGLGAEWAAWQRVSLHLQVDGHAGVADSGLDQLGSDAAVLTAGLTWRFSERWRAEISIAEDIAVDTAPDFVFQAGVHYTP